MRTPTSIPRLDYIVDPLLCTDANFATSKGPDVAFLEGCLETIDMVPLAGVAASEGALPF